MEMPVQSKFDEILDRIKRSTGVRTQVELAAILGIRQSSISDAKRRDSVPADWYLKLFRSHGLNPDWLSEGIEPMFLKPGLAEAARASGVAESSPAYGRSSARAKVVNVSSMTGESDASTWAPDVSSQLAVPETMVKPAVIVIHVDGSAMEPAIRRGAYVGIDTDQKRVLSGEIYGLYLPHEGLVLKRVYVDVDQARLVLRSENPSHPEQYLPAEKREDAVIGRAVWIMQNL